MTDILNSRRINPPPFIADTALRRWLEDLADELNALPPTSTFSYTTPNSNVTAQQGTIGVNYASNTTLLWLKSSGNTNTGWVSLQTA